MCSRLSRLVEDLLDVSALDRAPLELERKEVDFAALVRSVVERHSAELATAECSLTLEASNPVKGLLDPERMEQVVVHLLANAMRYAAGAPVEVRVEPIGGGSKPLAVRLVVQDHGVGIPPEDQARVFGRFERAHSSENYGGLGDGALAGAAGAPGARRRHPPRESAGRGHDLHRGSADRHGLTRSPLSSSGRGGERKWSSRSFVAHSSTDRRSKRMRSQPKHWACARESF